MALGAVVGKLINLVKPLIKKQKKLASVISFDTPEVHENDRIEQGHHEMETPETPQRESVEESNDELSSEFSLSESEISVLKGIESTASQPQTTEVDKVDPSNIKSVDVPETKSVKIPEAKSIDFHESPDLSKALTVKDGKLTKVDSDTTEVIKAISTPEGQARLNELNSSVSQDTMISIGEHHVQMLLTSINGIDRALKTNEYVFMGENRTLRGMIMSLSNNVLNNQKIFPLLAKYLVSKDGELVFTLDDHKNLMLLPSMQDKMYEGFDLSGQIINRIDELGTSTSEKIEGVSGKVEDSAEQSAEIQKGDADFKDKVMGGLGKVADMLDPLKMLPLLILGIDGILSNLTIPTIEDIGFMLKKQLVNMGDMLRYWWKSVEIPGIKSSEGDFKWNGGDFYFEYKEGNKSGYQKGTVERTEWTDDNREQVTKLYDAEGKLQQAKVTRGEHKGQMMTVGGSQSEDYTFSAVGNDGDRVKYESTKNPGESDPLKAFKFNKSWAVDVAGYGGAGYHDRGVNTAEYSKSKDQAIVSPHFHYYEWYTPDGDSNDKMIFNYDQNGNPVLDRDASDKGAVTYYNYLSSNDKEDAKLAFNALMEMVKQMREAGHSERVSQETINEMFGGNMTMGTNGEVEFSADKGTFNTESVKVTEAKKANPQTVAEYLNDKVSDLVENAKSYLGKKLKYSQSGPRNPKSGSADCSSFVNTVYKDTLGINVGSTSLGQWNNNRGIIVDKTDIKKDATGSGREPDESKLQVGDLLFWRRPHNKFSEGRPYRIGHVGMYIGDGQYIDHGKNGGPFIHQLANDSKNYIGAKRFIDAEGKPISVNPVALAYANPTVNASANPIPSTVPTIEAEPIEPTQELPKPELAQADKVVPTEEGLGVTPVAPSNTTIINVPPATPNIVVEPDPYLYGNNNNLA